MLTPAVADQRVIERLFRARLAVGNLRIGHARGRAARQLVEVGHLSGGRRQQRLLRTAAGHRPGAQIGHKAPGAEDRRMPGLDGIDVDEAGQHFGDFLRQGTGQRGRRGGAGLPGRQQQHGHAAADGHFQAPTGVGREFHRRHHEAVGLADKRALAPLLLAAGDRVQHLEGLDQMVGVHPAAAHVLGRAHDRGIAGVEIHLVRIGNIARHDGALEEMDVIHDVDDAADVVQILDRGVAVPGASDRRC